MTRPKTVLLCGAVAVLLSGLLPPWIYTFSNSGSVSVRIAGYKFLLTPPVPEFQQAVPEAQQDPRFGIRLDVSRLAVEWLCIAAAMGAAWLVFVPRGANKAACLIILSAAFLSLPASVSRAQAPPVRWVQQSVSSNNVFCSGVALDGFGNAYVVGGVSQTTTLGSATMNGAGGFLAKYDSFGNVLWAIQAGGTDGDHYNMAVAADGAGNSYFVGYFGATATFGNITITNTGGGCFVAKADSGGNFLWAKSLLSRTQSVYLYGVVVDTNGNSYVTGYDGDATFATNLVNGAGFVAKFDSGGNLLWATPAGGQGMGVALDETGNIFVVSSYSATAWWGNSPTKTNLTSIASAPNVAVAKYDGAGNLLWVSGSTNAFSFSGVGPTLAVGSDGSAYVTGLQYPLAGPWNNSFVCKYSAAGSLMWLDLVTNMKFSSIAVDSSNYVYAAGLNPLPGDLNGCSLWTYDESGKLVATNDYGSAGSYGWPSMAVDSLGQNIYLTGDFFGTVTFSGFTFATGTNNWGLFLADLSNLGPQPPNVELKMYPGLTPGLTIQGFVGDTYQLDYADSLQTNWHPWVRFVLPSSPFTLFDPSPSPAMRFYRAALVLP